MLKCDGVKISFIFFRKGVKTRMEYVNKAIDLISYIFDLVNKILTAVNGEESEEVKEMEGTETMVKDIAGAVQTFAGQVNDLTK